MPGPTYFNSVERIIQQGYEEAQLVAVGGTLNSEQIARGMNRLNDMINHWMTKGLKLWTWHDRIIPLSTSTNYYPIGPGQSGLNITKPFRIESAYYKNSGGSIVTLTEASWQEWNILPNKTTNPGQLTNYFEDKQATYIGMYVWPIPSQDAVQGELHVVLRDQPGNAVEITNDTMFPLEWMRALYWGLADELCTGQPAEIIMRCSTKAAQYLEDLENWDVEDATTFFTVDTRGGYYGFNFA